MAEAAAINRRALQAVEAIMAPGVSTAELNRVAEDTIVSLGGRPAFKGYRGFPATLCTSLNDVVVHGIPNDRLLRDGDILSIDIGTFFRGYAADMAKTYAIGTFALCGYRSYPRRGATGRRICCGTGCGRGGWILGCPRVCRTRYRAGFSRSP